MRQSIKTGVTDVQPARPGGAERVRTGPSLLLCAPTVLLCKIKIKRIPENNGKYLMI